jgi:spore germination protein GerM
MKDLADRLVAMSPEPPPFPEEIIVTQPRGSRPSPVLMFAGAAVVVLILAAIPLLLFRGGGSVEPIASTTTPTVPSTERSEPSVTSTTAATTTTLAEETTTTVPAQEMEGVVVFLVQEPENSFTGNPAVVPFFALAEAVPGEPELAALRLLTADGMSLPPGFMSMIPGEVEVLGVERDPEDHWITIDMNRAFLDGAGGLLADVTMLNQLIFTVTSEGGFTEVLFTVEGQPVTQYGTEGLVLTGPVGRDSFLENLNSVIVDSAATGSGDSPLNITGFANVFEASVSLELVDSDGNVVYEDFTTASCGTGCWGGFSFHIEGFDFGSTPVTLKVFWHSPEDGSPADVVTIPVLWDDSDGWDLLPG